jgi:hypothetical protein
MDSGNLIGGLIILRLREYQGWSGDYAKEISYDLGIVGCPVMRDGSRDGG